MASSNMIIDRIQYSFIYLSYKSYRVKYRGGKGYLYIKYTDYAHRIITILFALTTLIVTILISGNKISDDNNYYITFGLVLLVILYLDISVSKKKMLKYRYVYKDSKKYALYYILFLIILIAASFLFSKIIR